MATILIVEADRNMRLLTAARLVDHYTVVSTCDGLEALERIHCGTVSSSFPLAMVLSFLFTS